MFKLGFGCFFSSLIDVAISPELEFNIHSRQKSRFSCSGSSALISNTCQWKIAMILPMQKHFVQFFIMDDSSGLIDILSCFQ